MYLYYIRFIFYFFIINSFFKVDISGFNCCADKKEKEYIVFDLNLNEPTDELCNNLAKLINSKSLNETANVNLENKNNDTDKYNKEKEILKRLKDVFTNQGNAKKITDVLVKDINECSKVVPESLHIGYDGNKDLVIGKDKNKLLDYFKNKNKDKNIEYKGIQFNNLLRFSINDSTTIGNLIDNLKESKSNDIEDVNTDDILFIIFNVCNDNNFDQQDLKFTLYLYFEKKQ